MRSAAAWPALAVALAFAAPAQAQPTPPATVLDRLPPQLASFRRAGEVTDFGAQNRPDLGAAVAYQPAAGPGVATVYVYDGGAKFGALPPGPSAPAVSAQMRSALGDIEQMAATRRYSVAASAALPPVPGPDGRPALQCQRLLLQFERGRSDSTLCLGVVARRFLKLRVTLPLDASGPGGRDPEVAAFAAAVVAAIRP